jgi:multidrug efflux pump subunit AcrB
MDVYAKTLPSGYRLETGGEAEEQVKGFAQLAVVLLVLVLMIYMALAFQFKNVAKPLIVLHRCPTAW